MVIKRNLDDREYDQLDSLTSSTNMEISRLSIIVKNLRIRLESLEKNQTDLMDKLNEVQRKMDDEEENDDNDD
jgi:predicted  nucleic acid-binding Zn-ribbon protein